MQAIERKSIRRTINPLTSTYDYDLGQDFDELLPQPQSQPLKRRIQKTIWDGDGAITTTDYYITVDPMTDEQKIDVNIQTNRMECAQCGRLVSPWKLYECSDCSKRICGVCLTSRKIFLGKKRVCLKCARRAGALKKSNR